LRTKIVTIHYDWQSDPCVIEWKKKLSKKSATKSTRKTLKTSTWKNNVYWFEPFLDFHKMTPTELIAEATKNNQVAEDRIDTFYDYAIDKLHRNIGSAVTGCYGNIQGFYSHNDILTKNWSAPQIPPAMVEAMDDNYPLFFEDEKTGVVKFDVEKYSEFLDYLNYRDQIIAKCMKDTGLDSSDLFAIPLYVVRSQSQHERIMVTGLRRKTGKPFRVFFSKENTKDLRKYDKSDRFDAEDSEPIFVELLSVRKSRFKQKHHHSFVNYDMDVLPKAKPVTVNNIATNFRVAQINMGIPLVKGQQGPFRPKRNRHIFDDGCSFSGIPEIIKKIMKGTADKAGNPYPNKSRQQMEIHYKKFERLVTLDRMEMELDILQKEENAQIKSLEEKVDRLEKEKLESKEMNWENVGSFVENIIEKKLRKTR